MANNCMQQLLEQNDRLYRLLDRSLNGTLYTERLNPDGSTSIDPPIDPLPPASPTAPNALRAHVGRLVQLGENSVRGATYAAGAGMDGSGALDDERSVRDTIRDLQGLLDVSWFNGGRPGTLADIIRALRVGKDADQGVINDALQEILGTGSDANSIINTIRGLFDTAVDTSLEGAQLAVQLVAQTGQIAAMVRMVNELKLLNTFLSGTDASPLSAALPAEAVLMGYNPVIVNDPGIPIGDLARQGAGYAERIAARIAETTEQRRIIPLLGQILHQLGGAELPEEPGAPLSVTLDAAQYGAIRNLLECICEATNGPPATPAGAPQFDSSHCGPEWELIATWRPTASGLFLDADDGEWIVESGQSVAFLDTTAPGGLGVLKLGALSPYDCRVYIGTTGALAGETTPGNLYPLRLADETLSPGRPSIYVAGADLCVQANLYELGAQDQQIGYSVNVSSDTEPITPDNLAVFVMFQSFG